MNILLTQSKTDTLSDVIKFNTQDNSYQTGNTEKPSFVDVLYSDQEKADSINAVDSFAQRSSGSKHTSADFDDYDHEEYENNNNAEHFGMQNAFSELRVDESDTSNIEDQMEIHQIEAHGSNVNVIKELSELLSLESDQSNGNIEKVVKELVDLAPNDVDKTENQEVIAKLAALLSVIDGKRGNDLNSDIVTKLRKLISHERVENKNKETSVMLEKSIVELRNRAKEVKSVKNSALIPDKGFRKSTVNELDEHTNELVNNKENNLEKKQVLFDKLSFDKTSNNLNSVKASDKSKESIGRLSKSTEDVYLENETTQESRPTQDIKNADTQNSVRDITIEQKVTDAQSTKNSLTDQHQHNTSSQHGKKEKDNNEFKRAEVDRSVVNNKTQDISSSGTNSRISKTSTQSHTISQSQLGEMVVSGARQFKKGGNSEIHLTIRKPDLGNIKISFVENAKGKLEVFIVAERHEASELIKQNSTEIKQLLMQEGIDLSKFDVDDSYNKNKRHFAQGNEFQMNNSRNSSEEDNGSSNPGEILAGNHDMNIQNTEAVNNQQVNLIV